MASRDSGIKMFQHTAARRRLTPKSAGVESQKMFQHTAARRRLRVAIFQVLNHIEVSTHSRPKAAEICHQVFHSPITRFNTQPPEGG